MKNHLLRISLCLLLYSGGGVVTTVGVAWGLAAWDSEHPRSAAPITPTDLIIWRERADDSWPSRPDTVVCAVGVGVSWRSMTGWGRWPDDLYYVSVYTYGLPARALQFHGVMAHANFDTHSALFGNETTLEGNGAGRALPLRPIFPGFLVNTLFYAAIWFGIFFGVAALRRALRKKRRRCVKCSYDLRGHQLPSPSGRGAGGEGVKGCPECGWGRGP